MWIVLTKLFCVSGCQATSGFTKVSKALRGCSSWKAPNRPAGVGCAEICIKINIGKRDQRCSVFEDLACTCMGEKYVNIPSEKFKSGVGTKSKRMMIHVCMNAVWIKGV